MKFLSVGKRFISASRHLRVDINAELKCQELLTTLQPLEHLFDHHNKQEQEQLSEDKLKTIAFLNKYSKERKLSLMEQIFTFPKEYEDLYLENDLNLYKLRASSGLVIDKIPYEDTATGELKWKIVRDDEKSEGWETIAHLMFIPAFVFLSAAIFFRDDMDVTEWARRELLFRIKQEAEVENNSEILNEFNNAGGDPRSVSFDLAKFNSNDEKVIERILSGEYDKLAKLQQRK